MSDLRARLAATDSGLSQFAAAADYFGSRRPGSLNRWCDLRARHGHGGPTNSTETMADLLQSGAVSEADVQDCFLEAA